MKNNQFFGSSHCRVGLLFVAILMGGGVAQKSSANEGGRLPSVMKHIEAVNVPKSYVVVSGTVTVTARGLIVNPADVTFSFYPEFPFSTGYLVPLGQGRYALRVERVPSDEPHTLTIRSAYNDTIVRDEKVERLGRTYSGHLRIEIPMGRSFSIGEQLLDLR